MTNDAGMCSIFVLLDLNAAFNTINHRISIRQTEEMVGHIGWILSFRQKFLCPLTPICLHLPLSSMGFLKGQFWDQFYSVCIRYY